MSRYRMALLLSFCFLSSVATASAVEKGTRVEIGIEAPQDGASISGPSQVMVRGQARAFREYKAGHFDLMLILDTSGSTRAPAGVQPTAVLPLDVSILAAEVAAAERLLARLDPGNTLVGIVTFAGEYNFMTGQALPNQPGAVLELPLTTNYPEVQMALRRILARGPNGGTDMAAGVRLAVRELAGLEGAISRPRPESRKVALLLTDGIPTLPFGHVNSMDPGDVEVAIRAAGVAAKAAITIHTFALGMEALSAPYACTQIARMTGGTFTPLKRPGDIIEVLPRTSFADLDMVVVTNTTTGQPAGDLTVGPDGRFQATVPLASGVNQIAVMVLATDGTKESASVRVRYVQGESLKLEVQQERKDLGLELKRIEEENKRLEEALKQRRDEEARKKTLELEIGRNR
ncbi:MAG TPA: VWA domain-containing protein [Candidatus Methylomirabilis sp.]|nr:VWA domain-containing protein [Candidatus Methylomirabilis sp.]